jgi:transcriptional regulator with XRE-family HTH domain
MSTASPQRAIIEDHSMERAGEKLKRIREKLQLTYREVEQASQQVARQRGSDEFAIALSRLADIENKGTVPTIFRLYSLCAIYRLDLSEVLGWYGVPSDGLPADSMSIGLAQTHEARFKPESVSAPQAMAGEIDLNKTAFLPYLLRRWGSLPWSFLRGLDLRQFRYGFIGLEDWSMYPILVPGSMVVIDDSRRKIARGGWTDEFERPIYFLEHREGYCCGWCTVLADRLLVHSHPATHCEPRIFAFPGEIDVVGQVVGAAMSLEPRKHRSAPAASGRGPSPNP